MYLPLLTSPERNCVALFFVVMSHIPFMQDIDLMEYCDDVKHFEEHGHASCNGYAMATSLASDIATNLREVVVFN